MHSYSIDTQERRNALLFVALISVLLAWVTNIILNALKVTIPWWSDSPSIFLYYGILYFLLDKWFWKILKKINIFKVPDISGSWEVLIKSSFDDLSTDTKASLRIFQSWTSVKITLTTPTSVSKSTVASISSVPEGFCLSYQYLNEPKMAANPTMNIHRGVASIIFSADSKFIEGEYYSGRGRQNYGSISLAN